MKSRTKLISAEGSVASPYLTTIDVVAAPADSGATLSIVAKAPNGDKLMEVCVFLTAGDAAMVGGILMSAAIKAATDLAQNAYDCTNEIN